jgi:hypothetical protein
MLFFYFSNRKICIFFYMNNILYFCYKNNTSDANEIIRAFKTKYEIKNKRNVKWFLGIRIIRNKKARKVFFLHDVYIKKIAAKFQINDNSHKVNTLPAIHPTCDPHKLTAYISGHDNFNYT